MTLTAISPLFATRIFSSLQVALRAPPLGLNFRFTCATFVLGVHSFGKLPTLPTMKPHDVALISLAGLTKKPWFEERKTRGEKEEMKQNAWEIIGSWRGLTRGELTDLQTVMESILRQKETEDERRKKLNRENGSQFKLENTQYRPNLPRTTQEKRIRRGGRRPRERIPSHRGDPSDLSLPEGKTSGLGDARARLICEEADEGRFDEFEARGGGGGRNVGLSAGIVRWDGEWRLPSVPPRVLIPSAAAIGWGSLEHVSLASATSLAPGSPETGFLSLGWC